jgi:hypothetical protein
MDESLRFEFSPEKSVKYAEFLLRHYRLVDAYWFLKVEDKIFSWFLFSMSIASVTFIGTVTAYRSTSLSQLLSKKG